MVALDGPSLGRMLDDVAAGKIQLPDFQRQWKWDDDRIRALLATVTLDYPLGVAMTLDTGGEAQFKARPLHGTGVRPDTVPEQLLLDGQQRLTSLFQALQSDRPVETSDARNKPVQRWYYIDISLAVDEESDRDEAIRSVPADRILRGSFGRIIQDLTTREAECAAGYFPLNLIFDADGTGRWQRTYVSASEDRWDTWSAFQAKIIDTVKGFKVPLIRLPRETRKDAVCSVFERVNTGGVILNVFELLTATYAGDDRYTREHGRDFSLSEEWKTTKQLLSTAYPVFGSIDADSRHETGLTSLDFLQTIALVQTWQRKQRFMAGNSGTASPPAVSCKRRDLLRLPLADYNALAPEVTRAFAWVGKFLGSQHVFRERDLPYGSQLVPLAAIAALLGREALQESTIKEGLSRWYWCGVLGELYGGVTDTRFVRDVEQVIAWLTDGGSEPDTITEASFQEQRLHRLTSRNSAAYKGIHALLMKEGAVDWLSPDEAISAQNLTGWSVDIRQVFPKAWFDRNEADSSRMTSIVNKTALSYQSYQAIGGNSPSVYLAALEKATGLSGDWLDDVVGTHLISPKTLRDDDFDAFYRDRAERLLGLVERAMGKVTVREEADVSLG
ncbi:GmrSD restriction endonuclease domain-containing protein [Streptomyces hirsutus]|uniref:GmrSD restriction endonuclease domain-containing protein n=1 Tax=Streptomyces hirsutus TaxID=35620 RepID=UPI003682A4C7